MSSAAVPAENFPGIVKAIPGSGENRSPSRRNRCSPSARNPVRLHPGTLFTFTPESFSPSPGIRNQELNGSVWERAWQLLSPTLEVVAVYYRQRFCLLTLAEYGRILLEVAEPVRAKLRDRLRQIERDQYSLLENARSP